MIASQASHRRRSGGQAMVEFAVVFPIAMVLLMMVFDLGSAVYAMNTVGNAARQGIRTAIVDQYAPNIRQRVADQATALGIDPTATSCSAPNWSANPPVPAKPTGGNGVCIEYRSGDLSTTCSTLGVGCIAVVTVKSTFTAITPLIGQLVPSIPFISTSKQPIEAICTTSSCPVP